jgi:D-aminopeptidase
MGFKTIPFMQKIILALLCLCCFELNAQTRVRQTGLKLGTFPTGTYNAITDVSGVRVGHVSLILADSIRTGVTAIIPHEGNLFTHKVPAAVYVGNGFGKMAGTTQIKELGNLETPIVLTNTLNVPTGMNALIEYTLEKNPGVRSVNAVVGETNDGYLNDIRGTHVREIDVLRALEKAESGPVPEGNVGAGTGTICFGYKGGIGTSSRVLSVNHGGYTVGVLVQTNFGGDFMISGVPVGQILRMSGEGGADGSCMIVVATDAPISERNLERLAKRAMLGLARTGGIASNGSGDYVISFSTAKENRIIEEGNSRLYFPKYLTNQEMTPLFQAVIEATEEAILNSLFAAETMTGRDGHKVEAIPKNEILRILKEYNRIK